MCIPYTARSVGNRLDVKSVTISKAAQCELVEIKLAQRKDTTSRWTTMDPGIRMICEKNVLAVSIGVLGILLPEGLYQRRPATSANLAQDSVRKMQERTVVEIR